MAKFDGGTGAQEYRRLVLKRTGLRSEQLKCPRETCGTTPCVARDGALAAAESSMSDERGICVGCTHGVTDLLRQERKKHPDDNTPF